jgi:hydrogenase/urease accessory protein HupE
MLTPLLLLATGAMVAADAHVPLRWLQLMALAMGMFLGYLNGSAMAAAMLGFVGLAGIVSALFVALALAAAWVVALRAPWARVAVRVAGSWVAASGLLLLAWSVRAA